LPYFFVLLLAGFIFAQNDETINDFVLRQKYESAQIFCNGMKNPDSLFFAAFIEYSKLVDYEAYETMNGKKTLNICEKAFVENTDIKDETLRLYRAATLNGMLSTIHIKRGNYFQGISKMNDSQKNWEKLINSKYHNEASFALALMQYYKITVFNKTPKNTEKLDDTLKKLRLSLSADSKISTKLYLSYIWVLQEQKLWYEADEAFERFFEKYPQNTMMLRAKQTILVDKNEIEKAKILSRELYEISTMRNPKNYADMLSAKRTLVFTLDLQNKKDDACKTANSVIAQYQNIAPEIKKTYWVKKHYEVIKKYQDGCKFVSK
jgi:tetratricopeptide (TPR) repeat protein